MSTPITQHTEDGLVACYESINQAERVVRALICARINNRYLSLLGRIEQQAFITPPRQRYGAWDMLGHADIFRTPGACPLHAVGAIVPYLQSIRRHQGPLGNPSSPAFQRLGLTTAQADICEALLDSHRWLVVFSGAASETAHAEALLTLLRAVRIERFCYPPQPAQTHYRYALAS
jgi:hypothetical protein